jgi:hypothetical protein
MTMTRKTDKQDALAYLWERAAYHWDYVRHLAENPLYYNHPDIVPDSIVHHLDALRLIKTTARAVTGGQ